MSVKFKRIILIIVIFCFILLLMDLFYYIIFINNKCFNFDSINSFSYTNDCYITVGSSSDNQNYERAKIVKYDEKKKKIWEKKFDNGYNSAFFNVATDNGNIIAVGSYESTKKEHKDLVRSALIVKYDKDGNLINKKGFQVLGNSKFTNILVVDDGYIVVGQSIYSNMTIGLSQEGGAFVVKYDKQFNEIWKCNYGGSKSAIYNDLVIINDYIYTVGKDSSYLGIISKYTTNGEYVSTVTYSFTDTLGFTGIAADDNNIYVVGAKKTNDINNNFDADALIIKYDFNLNKILETTYKGSNKTRYNKLIIDDESKILVVGNSSIYNEELSTSELNVFSYDGIFVKYDINLQELFVRNYDDNEDEYFTSIVQINNEYLIGGYTSNDIGYVSKFITYTKLGKLIK